MNGTVLVLLVIGLALLVIGAEALVRGASRIAVMAGISPLVIGLTIVAYGTSSPEMAVSMMSSYVQPDIAIGNVIGSNIFNILLILGLAALVAPLVVAQQLIRLDVPIMIGVSVLALVFGLDGRIGRMDGIILFTLGIVYTVFLIYQSRRETNPAVQEEYANEYGNLERSSLGWLKNIGFIFGGLALLVLGSNWLVDGATAIARALGVSELIIGLTIVAAGTSLPELATSIVASVRGERDIAVGNVVGSNIFNILAVLGVAAITAPNGVSVSSTALRFDMPVMIAVALACLPIFFTGNLIDRREGLLFTGYYLAYTLYLILYSTQHSLLPMYSTVMLLFVLPITAITLGIVMWRSYQARRLRLK
ncbi:calcium/sodium antiporter [Egbenema bharatensis]|uniref:calcium/sodium antiporter n=1 Tax=Egbenema bharatensis TaxID=3463334 RepID=UPI003A8579AE